MESKKINGINPVFIFSLPRSGSTLLQRVLMSHSKISSTAEPHILLPLFYSMKKEGVLANYSHYNAYRALEDLIETLPNKKVQYNELLRKHVMGIYAALSDDTSTYFLDKTPGYTWIIDDIAELFPQAKFIFLWRNPCQRWSSVIKSFGDGRFKHTQMFFGKSVYGFNNLTEGYIKHKDRSICLSYEDFVKNPEENLKNISDYLGIDFEPEIMELFSDQETKGRLGDPNVKMYNKIEKVTIDKWKTMFNSSYRKKILKKSINVLNEDYLKIQGYDKQKMMQEIKNLDSKGKHNFFIDLIDIIRCYLIVKFKLNLFMGKNQKWSKKYYLS